MLRKHISVCRQSCYLGVLPGGSLDRSCFSIPICTSNNHSIVWGNVNDSRCIVCCILYIYKIYTYTPYFRNRERLTFHLLNCSQCLIPLDVLGCIKYFGLRHPQSPETSLLWLTGLPSKRSRSGSLSVLCVSPHNLPPHRKRTDPRLPLN